MATAKEATEKRLRLMRTCAKRGKRKGPHTGHPLFKKGERVTGRQKGTPNKITRFLKEVI
jgi:hypothetical protein